MKKQDQLQVFVNSLSKQEKRYFRLFASMQSGDKKFMQLFDELEKPGSHHVVQLSKKLHMTARNLSDTKMYLQQTLLNALRHYDQDRTLQVQLNNRWQEVRLLMERKQFELAYSLNEKALSVAVKHEMFLAVFQLLRFKYNLLIYLNRESRHINLTQQLDLALEREREAQKLMALCLKFTVAVAGINIRRQLKKIGDNPLFKAGPNKLKSNSARILWHELHQYYCNYVDHNLEGSIQHNLRKLKIFDEHPELVYTWANPYLIGFGYLASHYTSLGKYEKALQIINRFVYETDGHRKDIAQSLSRYHHFSSRGARVQILCYLQRYDDVIAAAAELEPHMPLIELHYSIVLRLNTALAFFYKGNYAKAQKLCEQLQALNSDAMIDQQLCARILLVMVHYKFKNYALLPYLLNSISAWAKRHKFKSKEGRLLLHWMRKLVKEVYEKDKHLFFQSFKTVVDDGLFKHYSIDLNLKRWVNEQ
jgi:hypothetical protein